MFSKPLAAAIALALSSPLAAASTVSPLSVPASPDLSTYMPRAEAQASVASLNASIAGLSAATVKTINGAGPVSGDVPLSISGVGNVSGLAYFHRYPGVTLTIPAVGIGGTGTATASVPGTVTGDQCFVAPTSGTSLLAYIMASGWVSVAGTVKVALAAPSIVAISATTVTVNMLCAQ